MAVFKHNLDVWKLERLQQEAGTALTGQELDWWRIICVLQMWADAEEREADAFGWQVIRLLAEK